MRIMKKKEKVKRKHIHMYVCQFHVLITINLVLNNSL